MFAPKTEMKETEYHLSIENRIKSLNQSIALKKKYHQSLKEENSPRRPRQSPDIPKHHLNNKT